MGGWTGTGQKIQPLSKQCRSHVKGLSKKRSFTGSVPLLSNSGQSSVKPASSSRYVGQRLDVKIHCLSKFCLDEFKIMSIFALDSIGTYLRSGKSVQGSHFELIKYQNWILDRAWTNSGHGHTLDTEWTFARVRTAHWTNKY